MGAPLWERNSLIYRSVMAVRGAAPCRLHPTSRGVPLALPGNNATPIKAYNTTAYIYVFVFKYKYRPSEPPSAGTVLFLNCHGPISFLTFVETVI